MSPFSVLYFLALLFVVAQGVEIQHEEPAIHHHTELKGCRPYSKEIDDLRMDAKIDSRERYVTLNTDPKYEFVPRSVQVKRCNGACENSMRTPMPTETRMKKFTVKRQLKGNPMAIKCVAIEVEEHVSCRCQCKIQAIDCHMDQYYDEKSCSCQCNDRDVRKRDCEVQKWGMVWHDNNCTCTCDRNKECGTGQIWDTTLCDCN